MTTDQINIAMARLEGWYETERLGRMVWYDPEGGHVFEHELPRYTTDLNAVHRVEKAVILKRDEDEGAYYEALENVIGNELGVDLGDNHGIERYGYSGWIAHATALQRCEAILKTVGKWEGK